jgi:hypothetical protein
VHEHLITQPQPIPAMQLRGKTAGVSIGGTPIGRTSSGTRLSD